MTCLICDNVPIAIPHSNTGLSVAISKGDGLSVGLDWNPYFPSDSTYNLAYNIYYSSIYNDVFSEGPKAVVIDPNKLNAIVSNFQSGDTIYFAMRPTQFLLTWTDLNSLPEESINNLRYYPESLLLQDLNVNDDLIYISDADIFNPYGVVQIGSELISYSSKDLSTGTLLISNRGFLGTTVSTHLISNQNLDGYADGYQFDSIVKFWKGCEEQNEVIFQAQITFEYGNYAYRYEDGYKVIEKDLVTTDLSMSDLATENFRSYVSVGYNRIDPTLLFKGACVGSYWGGEQYCSDGYLGIGRRLRGLPFNEFSNQREELLLENGDGEPCVLLQRTHTGIVCTCWDPIRQNPYQRCEHCFGTGKVVGYTQFSNVPHRADGRILVRFGPTPDYTELQEAGLESTFIPDCWTLVYPTIKDRDHIIRFNEDGTPEFRYEIKKVTRNRLLFSQMGAQKFEAHRVRKFDIVNQVPAFYDSSKFPTKISTGIGYLMGKNGSLIPHVHDCVVNESISDVSQINQLTNVVEGHSHRIVSGIVQPVIGNQSIYDGSQHDGHVHSLSL